MKANPLGAEIKPPWKREHLTPPPGSSLVVFHCCHYKHLKVSETTSISLTLTHPRRCLHYVIVPEKSALTHSCYH